MVLLHIAYSCQDIWSNIQLTDTNLIHISKSIEVDKGPNGKPWKEFDLTSRTWLYISISRESYDVYNWSTVSDVTIVMSTK